MRVPRTMDLTLGIWRGAIESARSPSPSRTQQKRGSPAMSPHIDTGLPALGRRCHLLDQAQDRRVQRVVEVAHVFVLAVSSQGVLDQVVGADGEEIALLDQQVAMTLRWVSRIITSQRDLGIVFQPVALGAPHRRWSTIAHRAQLGHRRKSVVNMRRRRAHRGSR